MIDFEHYKFITWSEQNTLKKKNRLVSLGFNRKLDSKSYLHVTRFYILWKELRHTQ